MPSFERPRGTRDFDPDQMGQRRALQRRLRDVFERFGYLEISTPTFEHLELFTEKSGDEIVKQLYDFQDKSERELTLRPELTAPVIRFFNNELRARPKPLRVYYYGNCFRYERPQSGRYREFWQFGAELIGAPGPAADAETIALADACIQAAGAQTALRVGHIGLLGALVQALPANEHEQAQVYREIDKDAEDLPETLEDLGTPDPLARIIHALARGGDVELDLGQDPDGIRASFQQALARLDGFQATGEGIQPDDALLEAGLGKDARERLEEAASELEETLVRLADHDVDHVLVDLGVARGLDYYVGVVFEIDAPELGAESQVAGGGRYALAERLGGQPTPTTGFGLGFDRVLLASSVDHEQPAARVHIAPIGDPAQQPAARLATRLRRHGIPTTVDIRERSISKNLDYADKQGIPTVLLLGSDEIDANAATVKDMDTGDQTQVPLDELPAHLQGDGPG